MSSLFVVEDSSRKITSHADVKCVAPTRNDVGAIDLLLHATNPRSMIRRSPLDFAQDERLVVAHS